MKRLVESWVRAEREHHGNNLASALRLMNDRLDTKVTHSRVAEWRRGVYVPSQAILSRMLYRTLVWALKQAGIAVTPEQENRLRMALWNYDESEKGFELL
jgi:hypothetical protein